MLTEKIAKTSKQLKQLNRVEIAFQDAEKKAKNDNDYERLVTDFTTFITNIDDARKTIGFEIDSNLLDEIKNTLNEIELILENDIVNEEILSKSKTNVNRRINKLIKEQWDEFYRTKTEGILGKITTISSLVEDRQQIVDIRKQIDEGCKWETLFDTNESGNSKLVLLCESIDKLEDIELKLNLSDDIRHFIYLVTNRCAKITDLTPAIIDWIKKEELEERFLISFKNN